jgi:hypothetical protein
LSKCGRKNSSLGKDDPGKKNKTEIKSSQAMANSFGRNFRINILQINRIAAKELKSWISEVPEMPAAKNA